MKAIFIDATQKTVTGIEIENDLHAMYDKIGCRVVQVVEYRDELIVCDEEARLKPWEHGFALGDWRICGNALIVSDNEDGGLRRHNNVRRGDRQGNPVLWNGGKAPRTDDSRDRILKWKLY